MKPGTRRRALRFSILDGCAYSLMVGGAESFLAAFAVFLGVGPSRIGLLSSVPQLVGSAAQLLVPAGIRLLRGLKPWVVSMAYLQAAVLVVIAMVPRFGGSPFLLLLLLLSCYWTVNLAIAPAWNHWMAILLPAAQRAAYFSRRNRVLHVCVLAGLVSGGLILERARLLGATSLGFVAVLVGGGAMRALSATFLACQSGPVGGELRRTENFGTFWRRLPGRPEAHLIPFLWLFNFAVAISAPYFVPFMLKELNLSYWTFMAITGMAFLAKSATMGLWARIARRFGLRRAFLISALLIIPPPALWSLSDSLPYLMLLQVVSGTAWAGFELCQLLLFYNLVEEERLSDVFSYYGLVNGFGQVAGAAIGGLLLRYPFLPEHAYEQIFVTSSVVRVVPILILLGALRRLILRPFAPGALFMRVVGLLPEWGSLAFQLWWRPRTRRESAPKPRTEGSSRRRRHRDGSDGGDLSP